MPKPREIFACQKCDAQFLKWEGRCRECGAWESLIKEIKTPQTSTTASAKIIDFSSLNETSATNKLKTGFQEFDRVLGGGLVPGSLILIGGDPGIGKSTLLLQSASNIAGSENVKSPVLYVSGEESGEQIKLRLNRLKASPKNLRFLGEASIEAISAALNQIRPSVVVVDSLQTIQRENGISVMNPSDLRTATQKLMELAKASSVPIILIGHVTKQGAVAGPKVLEHLVDAVLYFESGESGYRILRAVKNRFGGLQEVGVWQITNDGLIEVTNPSAAFLGDQRVDSPGAVVATTLQGSRVFLVEIQALVSKTRFGHPQRRTSGYELNRLQLLIAVLAKRLRLPLSYYDLHLNIVGGLKTNEPAMDLPVALAIVSALKNISIPKNLVAAGEIGLHGEVRNITDLERRIKTAIRLGFKQAITPPQKITPPKTLNLYPVRNLSEALEIALSK